MRRLRTTRAFALVQGDCYPGGSQIDVAVFLSTTSWAIIDQITGPLICEAEISAADDGRPPSLNISNSSNPFSTATRISFTVPAPARVEIDVFDVTGARIRKLLSRYVQGPSGVVTWDGMSESGKAGPSGVCFYRIRTGQHDQVRRLVVLR